MTNYDVIILGTGGVGSAAAYHLAKRGAKVLGIDRFAAGHDRGSSHGETRIIRQAYFEHSDYVPLLLKAYELWRELEEFSGVELLRQVGLLQVGPADGAVVTGVLASAQAHGLTVESHSPNDVHRRWPGFRAPESFVGVFEKAAGYLRVERCVLAHIAAAKTYGAEFRFSSAVAAINGEMLGESSERRAGQGGGAPIEVTTEDGEVFRAEKLIIAPGAWAPELLKHLNVPLQVRRKHVYWFPTSDSAYHEQSGFPTYLFELPHGVFYGFPQIDELGLKVAEHSGGVVIDNPLEDSRDLDPADLARVEEFLTQHLPDVGRPMGRRTVCYYTMSPDEHFIVDRHPYFPNTYFAAGLSGHGFKFTSVLGQTLADLSLTDQTDLPIAHLRLGRF